ncbi:hypothetical protein BHM03_00021238, partial [Ensete ventricosum]
RHDNTASSLPFEHFNKQFPRFGNADLNLVLSAVPNRPRAISPSSFSRKSAITHPLGFSILISLVRFHPISKLGGSGLCRPGLRPGSRRIADFHRFSISKEVVMAAGGRSGNSSDWLASRVGFESEAVSGFPMEGEDEVQRGPRKGIAGSFWREFGGGKRWKAEEAIWGQEG